MNCFTHQSRVAVGVCKGCGRGLCPDCAVELTNGIACKGRCEERVEFINKVTDVNRDVLKVANRNMKASATFSLALGSLALFVGMALSFSSGLATGLFPLVFGGLLVWVGSARWRARTRYPDLDSTRRPGEKG